MVFQIRKKKKGGKKKKRTSYEYITKVRIVLYGKTLKNNTKKKKQKKRKEKEGNKNKASITFEHVQNNIFF